MTPANGHRFRPARRRLRHLVATGLLGVLATTALAACSPDPGPAPTPEATFVDGPTTVLTGSLPTEAPSSQAAALTALPSSTTTSPDTLRLAEGVLPPTNRWFSSLALAQESLPVFPLPLSARVSSTQVAIGLPDVASTSTVITGAHVDRVVLDVPATSFVVGAWDELSVRVDHLDDSGTTLTSTLLAEGSPFVVVTARQEVTLGLGPDLEVADLTPDVAAAVPEGSALATTTVGTRTYAALLPDGGLEGATLSLRADEVAVLWAVPDDADEAGLIDAASHAVVGTTVTGSVDAEAGVATTELTYRTADDGDTAVVRLPHQRTDEDAAQGCDLGTYASVLGELAVCPGSTSSWTVPVQEARSSLDLQALSDDERAEVREALRTDLAQTPDVLPGDSYFGTKALYRLSMLADLADQLGDPEVRAEAVERLRSGIEPWLAGCGTSAAAGERCFVHDEEWHGVVGLAPSFGSEEFNDHHFHYGYLLHAAAVLGRLDPDQVPAMAPTMEALAADIAAPATTDLVPVRRVFDPYRSHSWASGTSPFADGNNQESSSEAVTAWAGLALWGSVSDRPDLAVTGSWLLANEVAATRAYWLEPDLSSPGMASYEHEVVALNWGGKRDWATWFSPEPSAMVGIQLLPLSPTSVDYLTAAGAEHITAVVAEGFGGDVDLPAPVEPDASTGGSSLPQFSDYLLAYRALAGPDDAAAALEQARTLPDEAIDGAFSRSYLLAWILAATHR